MPHSPQPSSPVRVEGFIGVLFPFQPSNSRLTVWVSDRFVCPSCNCGCAPLENSPLAFGVCSPGEPRPREAHIFRQLFGCVFVLEASDPQMVVLKGFPLNESLKKDAPPILFSMCWALLL